MKRIVACLLVISILLSVPFSMSYADSNEIEALRNTLKEYLGRCIDYEQYFHLDIGSSGYAPYTVTFSFDFRSGNQHVAFNVDGQSFRVSTYQEGDMAPLIALYKMLDLYPEISSILPSDYTLYYKVYFGDVNGESHSVEITPTTYKLFAN